MLLEETITCLVPEDLEGNSASLVEFIQLGVLIPFLPGRSMAVAETGHGSYCPFLPEVGVTHL